MWKRRYSRASARAPVALQIGILALLAFWLGNAAHAEPESLDPASSPGEEAAFFAEIPSVYAASKYEQKVTEAPAAISIITRDEIQKLGYRRMSEILGSAPGMFTTYDRNYDYLAVRGFGIAGDYNSRVLFLVDGHRINDAVYGLVSLGSDFPIDIDLIDRVEIVRGPSSSVYGSNAFLGVVNVITRKGRDFQGAELSAGGGSLDSYLGRGTYGNRFDNGVEMLVSGSYYGSKGRDHLFFEAFDDPATNDGVVRNADEDEAFRFLGEISFRDWKLQIAHSDRRKEVPTASYGTVFGTDETYTKDAFTWTDLSYQGDVGDGWLVSGRAFYDRYDYDADYLYDYPPVTTNRDIVIGERWGAELGVTQRFFDRHIVSVGTELDHNFRQDQENRDRTPHYSYLDDDRDSVDFGFYIQDEVTIFDWLRLNAGVRYDRDGEFGGTVNPRLASIFQPFEGTTLKLLYGTAFRAPSTYELYYQDDGETQKPNSNLNPETIETFEVVWEQAVGRHIQLAASGYYSTIEDLIELTTDPSDGLFVFQNRSKLEAFGLELGVEGRWRNGLEAALSYALQRTEDRSTNERLANSPTHLASGRVIVPVVPDLLFAGVDLRYISERKTLQATRVDDSFLTGVTVLNRNLIPGLEVQFGIDNLFDVERFDPASAEHDQSSIEQDGRIFFVKMTYQFDPVSSLWKRGR
jgi:iron complex outermembrane receptor protein